MFTLFTQPFHLKGPYEIYEKSYGPHVASALSNTGKYGTHPIAAFGARPRGKLFKSRCRTVILFFVPSCSLFKIYLLCLNVVKLILC